MSGITYSTNNYNNILASWSTKPLQTNLVNVNFGGIKYSGATAQAGKDILTGVTYNWTIIDGGVYP